MYKLLMIVCVLAIGVGCAGTETENQDLPDIAPAKPVAIPASGCNGSPDLCDKKYSDVVFATTHNAMSNEQEGWQPPNQLLPIEQQLNDGIRAMMLDTYFDENTLKLCHGTCLLGERDLVAALSAIKVFLDDNPGEIFTFLFQDQIEQDQTEEALRESGLWDMTYEFSLSNGWPTLGAMVTTNTRVVVMMESRGGAEGKLLHMWDHVWDSGYGQGSTQAVLDDCGPNRGSHPDGMYLLNHWIKSVPEREESKAVNNQQFMQQRVDQCTTSMGQVPNFIAVDHYSESAVIDVVAELNSQ